ncbi:tRNA(Ile)-lysidine synthase [Desulfohalotomaculum tongense]|uniref:tRNA lysidine(34) synthetase TilS n=1 Tax=Desulforadius tongensis TaxID=1216062 RepID=UPI00195AE6D7|nr:tRNA lysidine(34) synthetase TilS [Desulforadius tongensis]MBM7855985.1 tRNA(Ile)-lysidine synthase [Desulforadius tongensis]
MNTRERVLNFIQSHQMINPGELVLVAVSGGADSVALLHMLCNLKEKLNISLHVAHLNHMFRGEESREDARFVKALCQAWQVPCTVAEKDVSQYRKKHRLSSQVAAREVRYNFLEQVAQQQGAGVIALAHHADDQAETVMLNLIRGAGLSGLAGILPVRDSRYRYIRPLLEIRRRDIERYCKENGLKYRTDSSNKKTIYLRNKVRMHLMSILEKEYNPEIVSSLGRMAELCREEDRYIDQQVLKLWESVVCGINKNRVELDLKKFNRLHLAVQRRVIRYAWIKLTGGQKDLSFYHVEAVIKQCKNLNLATVELPGGYKCKVTYSKIQLELQHDKKDIPYYCYPLKIPGKTIIDEIGKVITAQLYQAGEFHRDPAKLPGNEAALDYDRTGAEIFVRKRRQGDVFKPQGTGGTVKLKKFFIDQKVPREKRDLIPIVCSSSEIIWVSGLRVGEYWKITGNTRTILHLKMDELMSEE